MCSTDIVKKSAKMGVLPMPERKMTLRKARCGHIDVTVDMLYPRFLGKIKISYTGEGYKEGRSPLCLAADLYSCIGESDIPYSNSIFSVNVW